MEAKKARASAHSQTTGAKGPRHHGGGSSVIDAFFINEHGCIIYLYFAFGFV